MISSESSTISGLRRSSTPAVPIEKRIAATTRYQATSGPCTRRLLLVLGTRARPQHDAADGGDEQHDRGDLEREQMIGQEEAADLLGAAERARRRSPRRRARRPTTARSRPRSPRAAPRRRRSRRARSTTARPRTGFVGAVAEVGDHEQEHHHHRAGIDEHLRGGDELRRGEQEEHGERAEVPDQRERGEERVRERDHREPRGRGSPQPPGSRSPRRGSSPISWQER